MRRRLKSRFFRFSFASSLLFYIYMFPPPPKTAKHSLSTVLIGAREYSGNVCFVFDNEQLWAHKGNLGMGEGKVMTNSFLLL